MTDAHLTIPQRRRVRHLQKEFGDFWGPFVERNQFELEEEISFLFHEIEYLIYKADKAWIQGEDKDE